MKKIVIDIIAGARPNFIKIAPFFHIKNEFPMFNLRFIHTGQHYDYEMSEIFLKELGLPRPISHLGVGPGSHGYQTAQILESYEKCILSHRPDICLVVGDVNSTIACALASAKHNIPIAHVEAGLRSFDRTMPEEINRILTDAISQWHFVTEPSGVKNLKNEGHRSSIYLVGNVMIDTLSRMKMKAKSLNMCKEYSLQSGRYALMTLHRPSNVDNIHTLNNILRHIIWTSKQLPVIFPVHPRTKQLISKIPHLEKQIKKVPNFYLTKPLGYLESLSLMIDSAFVITDSGGIQEETTALNIPCLTLRENTERPITISRGTNTLINNDWTLFREKVNKIISAEYFHKKREIPLWDGKTANRILRILADQ